MITMTDKEKYICLNCYTIGELSDKARCSACDSDVVASCEQVQNMTPRAEARLHKDTKPVSRHRDPLLNNQADTRFWYRFHYNGFETVVSYTKARNLAEAMQYARSPMCEWYVSPSSPEIDALTQLPTQLLNHQEYLQWCSKLWPLTVEESTV